MFFVCFDSCFHVTVQNPNLRTCALKMLYSKTCWSYVGLSDLLGPTAKFCISGSKIFIAMPYQSVSASLAAKASGTPPTLTALSGHMMSMSLDEFIEGGGMCACMVDGDFILLPEACIIGEFNVGAKNDHCIMTSLSWVGLTKHHTSKESLTQMRETVQSVLQKCCQPSEKWQETQLKAGAGVGLGRGL